jgi:hypothetical protein
MILRNTSLHEDTMAMEIIMFMIIIVSFTRLHACYEPFERVVTTIHSTELFMGPGCLSMNT